MNNVLFYFRLVLLMFLFSPTLHAADNMNLHGTLVTAPDCHINNDQIVEVSFGNVGVNKVNGVNYQKRINYSITCDGKSADALYLSINGTGIEWDRSAVKSSVDNLAIEIQQAGNPFVLGSQVKVDLSALPVLTAVPVKRSGASLAVGDFTAEATLIAFYQ